MDTSPKTIAFNNASQNRDHNIYTEEFFGGADQFIYVNGTRYDDISAIQWTIRETCKPIYGYASRKFDDIAIGTRIVQGVIKIPVRNTNTSESFTGSKVINTASLVNAGTEEVPNWVYKYSPTVNGSNGQGYSDNKNVSSSTISNVQAALRKEYPYVEVNGTNDLNTQKAILDYKRKNSLTVNGIIDKELTNRLDVENSLKTINADTSLKYQPSQDSPAFYDVPSDTSIIIEEENGDYYYVQTKDGIKGYIAKSEVNS